MGTEKRPHLLHHRLLAGEAFYRVLDASAEYVVVEVVSAPGLEPGARLRFTQAAVAEMSLMDESEWRRGAAEHGETQADNESAPVAQPDHEPRATP
jgi:hypothetical protein